MRIIIPFQLTDAATARYFSRVIKNLGDECWGWSLPANGDGYVRFSVGGSSYLGHKYSWVLHNGPIPGNLYVLHTCDNRACSNPAHLFLGTQRDNIEDMIAKGRSPDQRGDANPKAALSTEDVLAIRARLEAGEVNAAIARDYGVTPTNIWMIKVRRTWSHI